jgi:hypothetical protein
MANLEERINDCMQRISEDSNDIFNDVDRENLPDDDGKIQPWRDMDIGLTEEWEPARWNFAGRAYKAIYVSVGEFFTFMSGGTW